MMTIPQLHLTPNARRGAEWVLARHPSIRFTSGRRDVLDQAEVMAGNVVRYGRQWVAQTYRTSPLIDTLTEWLHRHDGIRDTNTIAHGFYDCLLACHSGELTRLSRHLTGDAWDAAWPGDEVGMAIVQDIREHMPTEYQLDKVLDREGSMRIIHVQFAPSVEI